MKKRICFYQIFSFIFVSILGTILQFTYKLSDQNYIVATFSSINESVWEHLKLIYFPSMLTIIIGVLFFKNKVSNLICSKTLGIIISMIFMITFFYTYTGILGKNIQIIDISSFYISALISEFISYLLIINNFKCNNTLAIIINVVIILLFIVFTFNTPKIGIFADPVSGKYGK